MKGDALKALQKKVGTTPDGAFGPNTARAIVDHFGYSPYEGAHLLGQTHHESLGFQVTEENLNYSAEGIHETWASRFPTVEDAEPYARNPEKLANKVYSSRMGNGDEASGDGWKYRGRGFIQLTGKDNVSAFARDLNAPQLIDDPSPLRDRYAFQTAQWFFRVNLLMEIAITGVSEDAIKLITRRINGGYTGLDQRREMTLKIYGWLR